MTADWVLVYTMCPRLLGVDRRASNLSPDAPSPTGSLAKISVALFFALLVAVFADVQIDNLEGRGILTWLLSGSPDCKKLTVAPFSDPASAVLILALLILPTLHASQDSLVQRLLRSHFERCSAVTRRATASSASSSCSQDPEPEELTRLRSHYCRLGKRIRWLGTQGVSLLTALLSVTLVVGALLISNNYGLWPRVLRHVEVGWWGDPEFFPISCIVIVVLASFVAYIGLKHLALYVILMIYMMRVRRLAFRQKDFAIVRLEGPAVDEPTALDDLKQILVRLSFIFGAYATVATVLLVFLVPWTPVTWAVGVATLVGIALAVTLPVAVAYESVAEAREQLLAELSVRYREVCTEISRRAWGASSDLGSALLLAEQRRYLADRRRVVHTIPPTIFNFREMMRTTFVVLVVPLTLIVAQAVFS